MKYRKKPIEIEAMQYLGDNATDIVKFMGAGSDAKAFDGTINTLEGKLHISKGDWIIRGVKGELYPCKPDIFEATYERT